MKIKRSHMLQTLEVCVKSAAPFAAQREVSTLNEKSSGSTEKYRHRISYVSWLYLKEEKLISKSTFTACVMICSDKKKKKERLTWNERKIYRMLCNRTWKAGKKKERCGALFWISWCLPYCVKHPLSLARAHSAKNSKRWRALSALLFSIRVQ